ncbi:MAG TPA: signal peptidase I [Actinomycetota bacterium]
MDATLQARASARPRTPVASLAVLGTLTILLFVMVAMMVAGFRFLVVRSGSMEPAIGTGDVVVVETVRPGEAAPGLVVTFRDATRAGSLVTHRVVSVERHGGRYDFVTRGDANTGEERWSVRAEGAIGVVRSVIPMVGYPLHWLGSPTTRVVLLVGGSILVGGALLRRVWRG